ncbi:MAG: hypothetical protein FD163_1639 [Hyphomonadaceae bacterium]|nr:MAG: hypothetical protein FD128_1322 [Hyphomonadaceae bacterium]KAF0184942.1 MAG: hypothetical protein FD163_1639 [Hyphomonadaceae bacterium]
MNNFEEREKGEELKHVLSQEQEFKIASRRNKLLGLWVAELLGLAGDEADKYALSVVIADVQEKGSEDVFRKVFADLQNAKSEVSEHMVRREMANYLDIARAEFANS